MTGLLLVAILGSSSFLFAQTVCIGTTQECAEAQQKLCASEPAPANFELLKSRRVIGIVQDQTGAKFESGIEVQLRVPEKDAILKSVVAKQGNFSLGQVKAGSYRLVVVELGKRGVERLSMFDQPTSLVCASDSDACRLSVIPTIHSTDNAIDNCPPR